MLSKLVTALLAAAAIVPAAHAQEAEAADGGYRNRAEQRDARLQRDVGSETRPFEAPQERTFQPRPEPAQRPDQPRRAAQDRPQVQGGDQGRGDGLRRDRGDAGGMRRDRGDAGAFRPQPSRPDQAQPFQPQVQGDRGGRDRGFGGFDPQRDARRPDQGRTPFATDPRRNDAARRGQFDRRADTSRRWNVDRGWSDGGDRDGRGRGWNDGGRYDGARAWNGRNDWNRRWRGDSRYDWNRYRQQNRSLFRLPRYYAPYDWNYGYRRFAIGTTLSSLLWGQDYWIDQPDYYRLPPAYGPYRWVRYYNDALLVDIRSGYVVDTVYDIFW